MTPTADLGIPLWHFTCAHGFAGIGLQGTLRPHSHPFLRLPPAVWLTDDPAPERDAVGLTSSFLTCDRMEYRYRVSALDAVRWADVRARCPRQIVRDLEAFADPSSWWLSFDPVVAKVTATLSPNDGSKA